MDELIKAADIVTTVLWNEMERNELSPDKPTLERVNRIGPNTTEIEIRFPGRKFKKFVLTIDPQ
jgi:hypothetical protein